MTKPCEQYQDRIRYALSDRSGVLRVEDFEIVDAPECREVAEAVRHLIVGRPLANIDLDALLHLPCTGDGRCMRAIASIIAESQDLFVRTYARPVHQEVANSGTASEEKAGA